jgi:hypothetical protein
MRASSRSAASAGARAHPARVAGTSFISSSWSIVGRARRSTVSPSIPSACFCSASVTLWPPLKLRRLISRVGVVKDQNHVAPAPRRTRRVEGPLA